MSSDDYLFWCCLWCERLEAKRKGWEKIILKLVCFFVDGGKNDKIAFFSIKWKQLEFQAEPSTKEKHFEVLLQAKLEGGKFLVVFSTGKEQERKLTTLLTTKQ